MGRCVGDAQPAHRRRVSEALLRPAAGPRADDLRAKRSAFPQVGQPDGPDGHEPEGPGRPVRFPERALGKPAREPVQVRPLERASPRAGTTQPSRPATASRNGDRRDDASGSSRSDSTPLPPSSSHSRLVAAPAPKSEVAEGCPFHQGLGPLELDVRAESLGQREIALA